MRVKGHPLNRREVIRSLALGALTTQVAGRSFAAHTRSVSKAAQNPAQPAGWPRFGFDLKNTRFNPYEAILTRDQVGNLKLKWLFETEAPIQTTPTVVGDTLFFGTLAGDQYALDSRTGKQKWKVFAGYVDHPAAPDQGVRSSCQFHEGKIYFGTGLAKIHCLDAESGKEVWQTQVDDDPLRNRAQVLCSVALYRNKVYVGTSSSRAQALCLDAETGAVRWRFHVVPQKERDGGGSIWTSPAIDEAAGIVYFDTGSSKSFMPPDPMLFTESMIAFDADTGEMLWYDQLRAADPFDLDYSCHPMIFDALHPSSKMETRPCVAAGNKSGFYCFNRYTGERYWKAMLTPAGTDGGPIVNSTAAAHNRIYLVSNATGIRGRRATSVAAALHAYTGDILWWVSNPAPIDGPVAGAGDVFYQGLKDGTLEAIDAFNGEQLWTHKLPGPIRSGMAVTDGVLYTSTGESVDWFPDRATSGKRYGVYAFSVGGR